MIGSAVADLIMIVTLKLILNFNNYARADEYKEDRDCKPG